MGWKPTAGLASPAWGGHIGGDNMASKNEASRDLRGEQGSQLTRRRARSVDVLARAIQGD